MSKSAKKRVKTGKRSKDSKGNPPEHGNPPELEIDIPDLPDLPKVVSKLPSGQLPIDILLLTVKDCELLSCYAHLSNPFKAFIHSLGTHVYFGNVADDQDVKVKIGLMRCHEGSTGPGSSLIAVKNAITVLRPKGAISVGYCSGLDKVKTKLGDVVVSAKLATYASKIVTDGQKQSTGIRTPTSGRFVKLIRNVADGWKAPLKGPGPPKVNVHTDGEILSGPEKVCAGRRRDELAHLNREAIALEMEGEGLYGAACDQGIEWLVVKGIADFADESATGPWQHFASVMAASVVFSFLSDASVFSDWPHYQESTRQKGDEMSAPVEKIPSMPAELIDEIRKLYQDREGWLAPFSWCEDFLLHLDHIFARLEVVTRTKARGRVTADSVNMSGIFEAHEECSQPRTVLIEGEPGMGKTTYCRKLAYDWATEKLWSTDKPCSTEKQEESDCFPRFQTVLLLSCRDMKYNNNNKTYDLWEAIGDQLLPHKVQEDVRKRFFNFIRQNQSKVLLVLDGLDEVPTSKFSELIKIIECRRELPQCRVVATARHKAGMKVRKHFHTLLEIKGFVKEDARKFISKYFDTSANLAENLWSEIGRHENLKDMVVNPLHTVLLCLGFEENKGSLPESRGQLYLDITRCILRRYRKKNGLSETKDDLIEVYDAQLKHLGRIALKGLFEEKLDFDKSELESHADELPGFEFLSVQTGSSKLRPSLRYSFQHKSFQEWFAAFFLYCQLIKTKIRPESLVADSRYAHELKEVLPYTVGLLAAKFGKDAVALTKCMMTKVNQGDKDGWLTVVLECTRECKQTHSSFQANVVRELGSFLNLQTLEVHDEKLSAATVVVLADVLKSNKTVTVLNLRKNDIGDASAASLAGALKFSKTLKVLKLSCNDIGDAGAVDLAGGLKFNTTLTELHLPGNCIGEAGAVGVADALKSNKTLTELDLSSNKIGDEGATALADGLKSNTTLIVLYLSASGISNGATGLADGLKSNTTLSRLNLSRNAIGDAGAAGLADLLKSATTLSQLNLSRNGIGDAGAAGLADALKSNTTPTSLDLSENSIGVGDIAGIADGLKFNTKLSELKLSCNHIGDDGAAKLADGLKSNTGLTSLNLSDNKIGDAGAANLADGLKSNTKLTVLHLSGNGIGNDGAARLAGALESNKTLTTLYLHNSGISDAGAAGLAGALKSNTTLTRLWLSGNKIGDKGLAGLADACKSNKTLTLDLLFP